MGSGTVERAGKRVLERRVSQGGTRWTAAGARPCPPGAASGGTRNGVVGQPTADAAGAAAAPLGRLFTIVRRTLASRFHGAERPTVLYCFGRTSGPTILGPRQKCVFFRSWGVAKR